MRAPIQRKRIKVSIFAVFVSWGGIFWLMAQMQVLQTFASPFYPQGRGQQSKYSNSRNGATPFFRQRDHKYATPPAVKPILCVFGNCSHRCFNRWHKDLVLHLLKMLHIYGKKNEGVAPLRELLYSEPELLRIFLSVSSHASSSHRFRIL